MTAAAPSLIAPDLKQRHARQRSLKLVGDLALVAPLFLFLVVVFVGPMLFFITRAVDNRPLHDAFPAVRAALAEWSAPEAVPEAAYAALANDIRALPGPAAVAVVARTLNNFAEGYRSLLMRTAGNLPDADPDSWRDALVEIDRRWEDAERWAVLKRETGRLTPSFLLAALDLERSATGAIERVEPERRLYLPLLARTFEISLTVAALCLLLGYPTAYVLVRMPPRAAGLLMIAVLLPFWTSLLVRTTAWIILLQGNGPINSALQLAGIIQQPLELIFNRFGALVAMTHVLLPYMVLPLYSAMAMIPANQMLAAQSLGAKPSTAFLRVYLPQSLPGVAAGLLLVFILALGYYITPALVGGPRDQMISYMISYHVNEVVNFGMASALAVMLLLSAMILIFVVSRLASLRTFMP